MITVKYAKLSVIQSGTNSDLQPQRDKGKKKKTSWKWFMKFMLLYCEIMIVCGKTHCEWISVTSHRDTSKA